MKRSSFLKKGALFAFLGILTCSLYLHKKFSEKALLQTSYSANDSFIPIPIKKYSKANIPSIEVQVEGISVMAELDLGLKGELSFSPAFVELLKEKRYLGANTFYGIRGIPHSKRIFEIPCATIAAAAAAAELAARCYCALPRGAQ